MRTNSELTFFNPHLEGDVLSIEFKSTNETTAKKITLNLNPLSEMLFSFDSKEMADSIDNLMAAYANLASFILSSGILSSQICLMSAENDIFTLRKSSNWLREINLELGCQQ
jgi:hypothetical protein